MTQLQLLIKANQLNGQQIAELLLLISKHSPTPIGERYMWGWVKKLFQSPVSYAVDLESVYLMAGF